MGALQPRAQGIPHNGVSSSHNGLVAHTIELAALLEDGLD
jgi:hypothetical protein